MFHLFLGISEGVDGARDGFGRGDGVPFLRSRFAGLPRFKKAGFRLLFFFFGLGFARRFGHGSSLVPIIPTIDAWCQILDGHRSPVWIHFYLCFFLRISSFDSRADGIDFLAFSTDLFTGWVYVDIFRLQIMAMFASHIKSEHLGGDAHLMGN